MEDSSWDYWHSEQLVLCRDDTVGLRAAIAIDDTTLGPGLGGVRCVAYPSDQAAIVEAQRLAAAMTLKNAFAGLPFGGAKSVIIAPAPEFNRRALMERFGEFVRRTGGAYLPGVDMGTSIDDLQAMGDAGADVSCNHEDPSPWTAVGVAAVGPRCCRARRQPQGHRGHTHPDPGRRTRRRRTCPRPGRRRRADRGLRHRHRARRGSRGSGRRQHRSGRPTRSRRRATCSRPARSPRSSRPTRPRCCSAG